MDVPIEGNVRCPTPHHPMDVLVDHLYEHSKGRPPRRGKSGRIDLIDEVRKREFEDVGPYEGLLGNHKLWTEDVKSRLVAVVEACESVGIPYLIEYENSEDQGYPASLEKVTIRIVAPDN